MKFKNSLSTLELAAFKTVYKAAVYTDNHNLNHVLFLFNEGRIGLDATLIANFVKLFNRFGYALMEYQDYLNNIKVRRA